MATTDQAGEIEALRAQVAELREELAEQAARSNAAIAAMQERMHELTERHQEEMARAEAELEDRRRLQERLDHWGLDIDALIERRSVRAAGVLFAAVRKASRIATDRQGGPS